VLSVVKQNATITVDVPENATPEERVNITGKVTDDEGKPLLGLPVNVIVNGKTYPTVTDENGTYNVPVDNTVVGENNVTVTAGNDTVGSDPVADKFTIEKLDTKITINPTSDVIVSNPITITGQLVDKNANPIRYANVKVTLDGVAQTVKQMKMETTMQRSQQIVSAENLSQQSILETNYTIVQKQTAQ